MSLDLRETAPIELNQAKNGMEAEALASILIQVADVIPPLWPLQDFVAVNPWFDRVETPLLELRAEFRRLKNCELLPGWSYFRELWGKEIFDRNDLETAYQECLQDHPSLYDGFDLSSVEALLEERVNFNYYDRCYFTVSESIDQRHVSFWDSHVINDISRHCGVYFDQGQVTWPAPWRQLPVYNAWKKFSSISHRFDLLGLNGFRNFVINLPDSPQLAIEYCLNQLGVPRDQWLPFLQCQLLSIYGWAAFAKQQDQTAEQANPSVHANHVIGLLAIRLAYDTFLGKRYQVSANEYCIEDSEQESNSADLFAGRSRYRFEELARYLLLVATEIAFRDTFVQPWKLTGATPVSGERESRGQGVLAQMVFCIDVRSETYRRQLESVDGGIETFGFAGFFGIPMSHIRLGDAVGTPQCPVLLQPVYSAVNLPVSQDEDSTDHSHNFSATDQKRVAAIWKYFRNSTIASFSFVESLGMVYAIKIFTDSIGWTKPVIKPQDSIFQQKSCGNTRFELLDSSGNRLSLEARADMAEAILRNLGLTENFAPLVVFCGHQTDVVNNPYRAGLDCGACGGHSGKPNAMAAANLFNDPLVRSELVKRNVHIPSSTNFIAAVHHTSTDEVELIRDEQTDHHLADSTSVISTLKTVLQQASIQTRLERSQRMTDTTSGAFLRRSRDWAEIRPEWGLAGNAAFIVAPRHRTSGFDLSGRAFLHSYDFHRDPHGNVLELIMTAPMVVANWINMQYYASTVDNRSFGSGDKVIHNVVGKLGILEGNGGDLKTGLPWQSIHDGVDLQHQPLRLTVLIEAPTEMVTPIIQKHSLIRNLVTNGWINLIVCDDERFSRWTGRGAWEPLS